MIQATYVNSPNNGFNNEFHDSFETFEGEDENVNDFEPFEDKNESVDNFADQFSKLFNAFAENIPNDSHEAKNSKNFFKRFSDYIGSDRFKNDVNEKADKYKLPPKKIAKNFFLKVLGILGDLLGIVVKTACSVFDTAVTILANILHGGIQIINKAGSGIVSFITLNQTNIA